MMSLINKCIMSFHEPDRKHDSKVCEGFGCFCLASYNSNGSVWSMVLEYSGSF